MAKSYLEPLCHLTKNGFDDARLLVLQDPSREQRSALIQEGMERCTTDEASVQLCLHMLDLLQQPDERATSELPIRRNDSRQPGNVQAALASAPAAHILPTFGISLQKVKPKRKATENADPFGDRVHKAAALSATNDGVSNLFNGEDDDDEDWEGMTAKHDHNLQGGTPAETSADFSVIEIRSTNLAIPILKIGAWVPDDVGLEDWQPLGNLESDVGITIHEKFLTHFASHDTKRAAYGAVARNAARYMDGGKCVNMAVWQKGCGQSAFEKAYGNKHRACDTCIRTKRLCVRVVADGSVAKLCVFPLPEVRREGRTLCSIAAWVIGG